jgi:hypothetical protein
MNIKELPKSLADLQASVGDALAVGLVIIGDKVEINTVERLQPAAEQ